MVGLQIGCVIIDICFYLFVLLEYGLDDFVVLLFLDEIFDFVFDLHEAVILLLGALDFGMETVQLRLLLVRLYV